MNHLGINSLFLIPGKVGGSETYFVETIKAMLPMLNARCTIFTTLDNDAALKKAFANVDAPQGLFFHKLNFRAENRFVRIIREQTELPFAVRKVGCDLLWSPGYTSPIFLGVRQVVSILDMQYRRFKEDLTPLAWLTTHILVSLGARVAKRIIAISNFSKDEIVELLHINPGKIDVTHLGVESDFSAVEPLVSETPYILSVAASYPHKNLVNLVKAFNIIARIIPHRLKLLGGKGLDEERLISEIEASPFKSRIDRPSWVTLDDLKRHYKGASLFVQASMYEGFGIPIIEAQSAGVPVIATGMGSIKEIGGEGIVIAEDSSAEGLARSMLSTLELDESMRKDLLSRAFTNACKFTWESCAKSTFSSLQAASAQ